MSEPSPGSSVYDLDFAAEQPQERIPASRRVAAYLRSLFPFISWIGRYNSTWLASDLIAGVTVGAIVVPQGMAYASLAKLDAEFGLYSSFVGVIIYWLFGTSKDISIGPVAVLSTVVGNLVNEVNASGSKVSAYTVAASLSMITGVIILVMGLLRCGWLVNLVSAPSLSAFMTGSAITIATSQVPTLLGLKGFSSRESPYKVILNIVTRLGQSDVNAYLGLSALVILYSARFGLTTAAARSLKHKHNLQLLNSMRSVAVIFLYTFVSWLVHRNSPEEPIFDVLGSIPQGFQHFGLPPVDFSLIPTIVPYLPATVVVMLVEHMAIAKSFGRANNYNVDASQEMVAIGVTNVVGPFFGGYASTGSFSRSAIQSKAGVRTPIAGIVTGFVVLLAVHLLTAAFYYIPSAVLSAVIVHAVGDLITPFSTLHQYWMISPFEVFVFSAGVGASIFKSIEAGLYVSVALSSAAYAYRSLSTRTQTTLMPPSFAETTSNESGKDLRDVLGQYGTFHHQEARRSPDSGGRQTRRWGGVETPQPGVVVYRFPMDLDYVNSPSFMEELMHFVCNHTQRTLSSTSELEEDQSWSASVVAPSQPTDLEGLALPQLQTVILDFSHVKSIDVTAIQKLVDLKKELDKYASPSLIDWHFTQTESRQVRNSLLAAGLAGCKSRDFHHSSTITDSEAVFEDHKLRLVASAPGAGQSVSEEVPLVHHAGVEGSAGAQKHLSSDA